MCVGDRKCRRREIRILWGKLDRIDGRTRSIPEPDPWVGVQNRASCRLEGRWRIFERL